MTGAEILNLPMGQNDADATTIRDYLKALLVQVWQRGESFSGKRPFGNSGWDCEVQLALVKGGAIGGTLTNDGYLEDCETDEADEAVLAAIAAL